MMNYARILLVPLLVVGAVSAQARQGQPPPGLTSPEKLQIQTPQLLLPAIDAEALRRMDEDTRSGLPGAHDKRLAVAHGYSVNADSKRDGSWQILENGDLLWRLTLRVPGATDLHLGFETYELSDGAQLWVTGSNNYYEGPYDAADAAPLWVPVVPGDSATIELRLPAGSAIENTTLALTHVGAGYRDLFHAEPRIGNPGASGACNINVVCPLGQPYSDEARALAYYEFRSGPTTYICTATLLNDVPGDRKNYALTAAHCMSTQAEVATMRLYWNYQSTSCASTTGYSFLQNQTGATLRATRADADFTLVELNQNPDPAWNLFYAGWDATGIAPATTIGLHHPSGDVAKVTLGPAPSEGNNCIGTGGGSVNTHWFTGPYEQGTTEGGSSGSGVWIPAGDSSGAGRRLIGVLSGGTALCAGTLPDNGYDCYGKFSAGWNGPAASSRLRDWLDPASTGALSVGGINNVQSVVNVDSVLVNRVISERQATQMRDDERGPFERPSPFNPGVRRD